MNRPSRRVTLAWLAVGTSAVGLTVGTLAKGLADDVGYCYDHWCKETTCIWLNSSSSTPLVHVSEPKGVMGLWKTQDNGEIAVADEGEIDHYVNCSGGGTYCLGGEKPCHAYICLDCALGRPRRQSPLRARGRSSELVCVQPCRNWDPTRRNSGPGNVASAPACKRRNQAVKIHWLALFAAAMIAGCARMRRLPKNHIVNARRRPSSAAVTRTRFAMRVSKRALAKTMQ